MRYRKIINIRMADECDFAKQQLVVTTRRPQRVATPAPAAKDDAWEIPAIQCYEPEDGVLYAQMGPTGGKHGYPAITGMKQNLLLSKNENISKSFIKAKR